MQSATEADQGGSLIPNARSHLCAIERAVRGPLGEGRIIGRCNRLQRGDAPAAFLDIRQYFGRKPVPSRLSGAAQMIDPGPALGAASKSWGTISRSAAARS